MTFNERQLLLIFRSTDIVAVFTIWMLSLIFESTEFREFIFIQKWPTGDLEWSAYFEFCGLKWERQLVKGNTIIVKTLSELNTALIEIVLLFSIFCHHNAGFETNAFMGNTIEPYFLYFFAIVTFLMISVVFSWRFLLGIAIWDLGHQTPTICLWTYGKNIMKRWFAKAGSWAI